MPPTRRAKALLLATAVILTTLLYVAMRRQGPTPQSASYLQTLRTVSAAERQPHPELAALVAAHTILIFSKSWCSYSKAAKQLLTQKYHTVPPPFIVELDQHAHGDDLQAALAQLTGRNTVPVGTYIPTPYPLPREDADSLFE